MTRSSVREYVEALRGRYRRAGRRPGTALAVEPGPPSTSSTASTGRRLFELLRVYVNFFQPVMKLRHKTRHGAWVHKVYDQARTPYQRLLASGVLDEAQQEALAVHYAQIDPVQLLAKINQTLEHLWTLAIYPDQQEASVTVSIDAIRGG